MTIIRPMNCFSTLFPKLEGEVSFLQRTANRVKRFGLGIAFGAFVVSPFDKATRIGLFGKTNSLSLRREVVSLYNSIEFFPNEKELLDAPNFWKEIGNQIDKRFFSSRTIATIGNFEIKSGHIGQAGIAFMMMIAVATSELFLRGVIQGVVCQKIPRLLLKRLAPSKEILLDSKTAKCIRVFLPAMFSTYLLSRILLSKDESWQKKNTLTIANSVPYWVTREFFFGCLLGAVKESRFGLAGAVGVRLASSVLMSKNALDYDKTI